MAFFSHTRTHTRTWQMTEWYVWQLWEVSEIIHGYWLMAFSFTHTHTRTWQMTEWYIWQLWEISEMFHGYWLMVFFFTHTHADMTDDRTCLTIVRSFRSVTRILAHGISLWHKHGHDRWQNIYLTVVRSFRDVTRILAHGILFHTHTHGHDWRQNDISDNCEKFQRCYSDTQTLAHGILLPATHTHTDMTDARIIYLTIVRSFRDITRILAHGIHFHTHTHTHRAFINGTHNTIMEKVYQWCCSWCIHTTSPDGWNLASTFPYRKNCSMVPVTQCIFQSWELDLSIFLDFLEHRKS